MKVCGDLESSNTDCCNPNDRGGQTLDLESDGAFDGNNHTHHFLLEVKEEARVNGGFRTPSLNGCSQPAGHVTGPELEIVFIEVGNRSRGNAMPPDCVRVESVRNVRGGGGAHDGDGVRIESIVHALITT